MMERIIAVSSSVYTRSVHAHPDIKYVKKFNGDDTKKSRELDDVSELIEDTMKELGGVWFSWSGALQEQPPDRPSTQTRGKLELQTTSLTPSEYQNAKQGFCLRSLWPLMHFFMDQFEFGQAEHLQYQSMNRRFAKMLNPQIHTNDMVWVHDFTLIPLAHHLRENNPRTTIGYYHHSSFPPFELLRSLPVWRELICQMCEYDHIAFQSDVDRSNFIETVVSLGGETSDNGESIIFRRRVLETDVIPTGVDPNAISKIAEAPINDTEVRRIYTILRQQRAKLLIEPDVFNQGASSSLGLEAFDQYLNLKDLDQRTLLYQINSQPFQGQAPEKFTDTLVSAFAERINEKHGETDWEPVENSSLEFPKNRLYPLFKISDACLLTSSKNNTDRIAKEYISSQDPIEPGVLIVSELCSAAKQLQAAIQINPYDRTSAANGILKAMDMSLAERKIRYDELIKIVHADSRTHWVERCIGKLKEAHFRLVEFEDVG